MKAKGGIMGAKSLAGLILAAGLSALACGQALAQDTKPVIIGAAIAQTGFIAPYDTDPARAAEMAIKKINAEGGVLGRPLKMIYSDTKSDIPRGGVAASDVLDQGAEIVIVTGD